MADGVTGDPAGGGDLIRERLERFIRHEIPGATGLVISDLDVAPHGLSREHYTFEARWTTGGQVHEHSLILIRDGDRPGQTERTREFRLLQALSGTSIPVPKPFWCDPSGEWLERPFIVMERVGGDVTPSTQMVYPGDATRRARFANRFVDILADLHTLDWRAMGIDFLEGPDCAPEDAARLSMEGFRAFSTESGVMEPHPVTDRAWAWSEAHVPRTQRLSICHGDYKPDNVLHADGEILAIVDWERARIGDPMVDLAYVCVPHLVVDGLASGVAPQDAILRRYADRSGLRVDPGAIAFWQVQLLLQTLYYFRALVADAERTRDPRLPGFEDWVTRLLGLLDQALVTGA